MIEPTTSTDRDRRNRDVESRNHDLPTIAIPVTSTEPETHTTIPALEQPAKPVPHHKKRIALILGGLGIGAIVASVFGYRYWQYTSTHQTTDNAVVTGHIHQVSSKIVGTIAEVLVKDNQQVQTGQLLVKLDPRDYQNQVQKAQAAIVSARLQANAAQATISLAAQTTNGKTTQAKGDISTAQAAIVTAQAAVQEAVAGIPAAQAVVQESVAGIAVAQSQVAQAQAGITSAQAKLAASQGGLQQATASGQQTAVNRSQYATAQSAIAQAQVALQDAQLQLSYLNITAPSAGIIGKKTAEVGNRIQIGSPLMVVVDRNYWIVANFKETQLTKMKARQPVEVKLDAIPDRTFKGYVDSIAPASGAQFSLLPPDNATGNFTKIVQRIPVKIVLDPQSIQGYNARIAPGMSAEVTIEVD